MAPWKSLLGTLLEGHLADLGQKTTILNKLSITKVEEKIVRFFLDFWGSPKCFIWAPPGEASPRYTCGKIGCAPLGEHPDLSTGVVPGLTERLLGRLTLDAQLG